MNSVGRNGASIAQFGSVVFQIGGTDSLENQGNQPQYPTAIDRIDLAQSSLQRGVAGASLPEGRRRAASVVVDGTFFLFGGEPASGGDGGRPDDLMATFDGGLGAFSHAPGGPVIPRVGATAIRIGDFVYVHGGLEGGAQPAALLGSIEVAHVDQPGLLAPFSQLAGVELPRAQHSLAYVGGRLVVVGGIELDGGTQVVSRSVASAEVYGDGGLSAFVFASRPGMGDHIGASTFVDGASGRLYVMGGFARGLPPATFDRGPPGETNRIDVVIPFEDGGAQVQDGGKLSEARGAQGLATWGSELFVIGGVKENSSGGGIVPLDNIERSPLP